MRLKMLVSVALLLSSGLPVTQAENDPMPNFKLFWQGVDTLTCNATSLSTCVNSANIYTNTNAKCQQYAGWQWNNVSSYGERIIEVVDINWTGPTTDGTPGYTSTNNFPSYHNGPAYYQIKVFHSCRGVSKFIPIATDTRSDMLNGSN